MPSLLGILLSWFPMLLLIGVWIFFMRQMQEAKVAQWTVGQKQNYLMSLGKVTFNDVAGVRGARGSRE